MSHVCRMLRSLHIKDNLQQLLIINHLLGVVSKQQSYKIYENERDQFLRFLYRLKTVLKCLFDLYQYQ